MQTPTRLPRGEKVENLLNRAITLAKAGRNQDAGAILKKIVKEEPKNEMA